MDTKRAKAFPTANNITAVIVTYHPDQKFGDRLERIAGQVAHVIIVDNSCSPSVRLMLCQFGSASVEIIENSQNLGIATALNQGVRRAAELGFSWGLMLDQDTLVDSDMVDSLMTIYRAYPEPERIGVIGSNARSPISGRLASRYREDGALFVEEKSVITSGSLLPIRIYECVGPFRDDFFIEGVDLEYCLRVRKHGYRVLSSRSALMTHMFGKMEERRFLGRIVLVPDHQPWRHYYIMRNFTRIVRSYFWQEPLWVGVACFNFVKTFIKIILFEHEKAAKFVAALRGMRDGAVVEIRPSR